jgi:hypothetical protein
LSRTEIAQLQRDLAGIGLYDGSVDGVVGPATRRAIRGFEQLQGTEPTGQATPALLEDLRIALALAEPDPATEPALPPADVADNMGPMPVEPAPGPPATVVLPPLPLEPAPTTVFEVEEPPPAIEQPQVAAEVQPPPEPIFVEPQPASPPPIASEPEAPSGAMLPESLPLPPPALPVLPSSEPAQPLLPETGTGWRLPAYAVAPAGAGLLLLIALAGWLLARRGRRAPPPAVVAPPPQVVPSPAPRPAPKGMLPPRRPGMMLQPRWHPPGELAEIRGAAGLHRVADGMVYTGSGSPEPSLIDPMLPVAIAAADLRGEQLPATLSYAQLSPASRLAYLRWLEGGKADPKVNPAYARLYFMGMERRLLVDRPPAAEVASLRGEVLRLVDAYTDDPLREGVLQLLAALDLLAAVESGVLPTGEEGERLALAERLATGGPLGFEEAMRLWRLQGHPAPPAEPARRRFELAYPNGLTLSTGSEPELLLGWYVGTNPTVRLNLLRGRSAERWPDPLRVPLEALEPVFAQGREPMRKVAQGGGG